MLQTACEGRRLRGKPDRCSRRQGSQRSSDDATGGGQERSLSAFVDAGTVWGETDKLKFSDLRYSTGLAFSWGSPIGPLKFSLGIPLKKEEGDKLQKFQFQLGSVF